MARARNREVPNPIPPKSVVRLAGYPKHAKQWRNNLGMIFRIGYYSPQDGLDCIWLVNEAGEYEQTIDHDYLEKYFDVIQTSEEKNLYGRRKPQIRSVFRALKAHPMRGKL